MINTKKYDGQVKHGEVLKHSQTGTNVPTQPTVPRMPPVKPNKNSNGK